MARGAGEAPLKRRGHTGPTAEQKERKFGKRTMLQEEPRKDGRSGRYDGRNRNATME
jgi:hypothetical protein